MNKEMEFTETTQVGEQTYTVHVKTYEDKLPRKSTRQEFAYECAFWVNQMQNAGKMPSGSKPHTRVLKLRKAKQYNNHDLSYTVFCEGVPLRRTSSRFTEL